MIYRHFKSILATLTPLLLPMLAYAQAVVVPGTNTEVSGRIGENRRNMLIYAVPLLTIAPDTRAAGMGDLGVASEPDANSQHWNPAKYPLYGKKWGISLSYIPWLQRISANIHLLYLSGFYQIDKWQAVAMSLRYFSLGQIEFTDYNGNVMRQGNPNEFAIDASYSRLFIEGLTGGVAFRFIFSDLTTGYAQANTGTTKPGLSYAADIGIYYQRPIPLGARQGEMAFALSICNIGSKLSYDGVTRLFIPTTLRVGGRFSMDFDDFNRLSYNLEASKLLVPTPPLYAADNKTILKGYDPNVGVVTGIFRSFYDAPGGVKEEFQEVIWSTGIEYAYRQQFMARFGYFHENSMKGGRQYVTFGAGVCYSSFSLDAAYLLPTSGFNSPLANTVRFSLMVNLDHKTTKPPKADEEIE